MHSEEKPGEDSPGFCDFGELKAAGESGRISTQTIYETEMKTVNLLSSVRQKTPLQKIGRFFTTVPYIFIVCLLTLLSNTLALELYVYTAFVLTGVYICLFAEDLLGLVPIVICAYMAPSVGNNPGRNGQSVFSGAGGVFLLCLGGLLVLALIFRIITDRKYFFGRKYKLLPGILALGAAYCLGGIGSPAYPELALKNLLFALLQLAAIALPYVLFSGGVRWEKTRNRYFAWTGFCVGGMLVCEVLWIYLTGGVVVDGVIDRDRIYTGWGIHNNLGGMLAMMIPFAFWLAAKYRKGWIGSVVGCVFLAGVFMTCSRSSILVGCAAFLVCITAMLADAENRRGNGRALLIYAAVSVALILIFRKQLLQLFDGLISVGLDPSSRDTIYAEGLKQFVRYPIFGGSFYPIDFAPWDWSTESAFSDFFPPRWHNTLVQLLASCGIVGLLAYGYHRFQTVRLLIRSKNREAVFLGCSVMVLLLTSHLDCHFFNIGPVLFYAAALAVAENKIAVKPPVLEKNV